jgi:hypothetical protein
VLSGEYVVTASTDQSGKIVYPQNITITLPQNGVSSWRIYFGTTSKGENEYVAASGGTITVIITNSTTFTPGVPQLSLGGALTRLFCYDLILKAWTIVDLPFQIATLKQFRTPGSAPITVMGGFFDSGIRRWQAGDPQWDAGATLEGNGTGVQWSFRDAEVFTEGGTVNLFHNQVIMRGDGGPSAIQVTPQLNGNLQSIINAALIALGSNQYEARVRILQTAENLNLSVSGIGPATVESISYEVVPKPAGAAIIIS